MPWLRVTRAGKSRAIFATLRKIVRPLVLAGVCLAALEYTPEPERTIFWITLFDLGHAPLFGIIAVQMRRVAVAVRGATPGRQRSIEAFGLAVGIGIATEVVQLLQPARDASVADVLRDAAGAAAFLLVRHAVSGGAAAPRRLHPARRAALLAAAFLLVGAVGAPFVVATALYRAQARAMPTLYALDGSWWERRLIKGHHSRLSPAAAFAEPGDPGRTRFARLDLESGTYPGLVFSEPYPNWSSYSRLAFTTRSDLPAPITLTLRVHDLLHNQRYDDRFNRSFRVSPGEHRIVIGIDEIRRAPKGRTLDLTRIGGIVLFAYRLDRPVHIYLGPLRLE